MRHKITSSPRRTRASRLLNAFMKQNKLSRTAAAKKLRYARPSISRWATGVRDPRDKTFARLEKRIVAYRQLQLDL